MTTKTDKTDFSTQQFFKSARWALAIAITCNRWVLGFLVLATVIGSALPAGQAIAARNLINTLARTARGRESDFDKVLFWVIITTILTLIQVGVTALLNVTKYRLNQYVTYKINYDTLVHSSKLDIEHFEDRKFQDLFTRASQDIGTHVANFVMQMLEFVTSIIEAISIIVVLIAIDPIAVLVVIPLALPNTWLYWRLARLRYTKNRHRATKNRWTTYFKGHFTTRERIPEVKIYNLSPLLLKRYQGLADEFIQEDNRLQRSFVLTDFFFDSLFAVIYSAIFWYQAVRVFEGRLTIGDLVVYGRAVIQLQKSTKGIGKSISALFEETLYVSDLVEFMETKPIIHGGTQKITTPQKGAIELRNVSFAYPGTPRKILKDISLSIKPGETVAIVGENGAGKTTLIHLLLHLYEVTEGEILFDGVNIRDFAVEDYYRQIAYVPQKFNLYEASVAENIAYGDWENLLDAPDKIREIAKATRIDSIIDALPEKYDTLLGRRFGEYDLSGGQWQRVAISRAFARNGSLIVLDEPTSNLDARAEYEIFLQFSELTEGRTTILISHRFSTVSMADRIIVLDEGRIAEQGSHAELIEKNGLYAELYRLQKHYLSEEPANGHGH